MPLINISPINIDVFQTLLIFFLVVLRFFSPLCNLNKLITTTFLFWTLFRPNIIIYQRGKVLGSAVSLYVLMI